MIMLPGIDALVLVGVFDRGVPNKERVVIRALQSVEMAQYGVVLAWSHGPGYPARPFNDCFFWFGDGVVQQGDTIFLYTGEGEPRRTTVGHTSEPAYVVHWGRQTTLFSDSRAVPMVVSFGQVLIANSPVNLPQGGNLIKG